MDRGMPHSILMKGQRAAKPPFRTQSTSSITTYSSSSATRFDLAHTCGQCGQKFNILSLLSAHKRIHDADFQARVTQRRNIPTVEADHNRCRYCDRKFDLERTLHIHQILHCVKIPPTERRKLRYTELNHVNRGKPLPKFQRDMPLQKEVVTRIPAGDINTTALASNHSYGLLSTPGDNRARNNSIDNLLKGSVQPDINTGTYIEVDPSELMRLSGRLIPCYMCKLAFATVDELTEHTLTEHNRNKKLYKQLSEQESSAEYLGTATISPYKSTWSLPTKTIVL